MSSVPVPSRPPLEDIAVVGIGCLFPGAPGVGAYWQNILLKVDAITSPPPEAWDPGLYFDANSNENDRVYCRRGGYLGPLAYFDPFEHGVMPRAVEGGEPDQWLALHVARQALLDAGYQDAAAFRERAALILGKGTYANRGTYSIVQHALMVDYTLGLLKSIHPELTDDDLIRLRADLKRRLPRFDAETAPALIPNVTVGRIANRLDIMGPSYTVDAACASSLVALDIAVKGLRNDEYDLALVGGLQAATPLPVLGLFCQLKALSASEQIRPFDKDADGTLLSEGIGMVVLKRRSQAERDGDRIYAVVKGTGVASDGRAVGVLAPRVEGEELALRRAYEMGGVDPSTIGLIEAHGTGTPVGDATEIEALARVFGQRIGTPHCALGSVKSMIGHTMPAAGMAGFIKAVLSLYHKVLPPTLHVSEPNPRLGIERTPFYLNTETRPWIHGDARAPRRAGVNSFGFGGINAHVVVEEAPASDVQPTLHTDWDSEVCVFSGANRDEVIGLGRAVAAALARGEAPSLAEVAFSLNTRPDRHQPGGMTLAIVAQSTEDLSRKLDRALTRLADPTVERIKEASGTFFFADPLARRGKLAFVFPGEGAQYLDMLGDLCRHFPVVRECFDVMDGALFNHPRGYRLSEVVFPPPVFSDAERQAAERRLGQMDVAVESVTVANRAMSLLLAQLGITPDVILGHSSGEFSAMRAAGMFDEEGYEARIVELNDDHARVTESGDLPGGARLIAVGAARDRVEALCAFAGVDAFVAMDNCPHQVVVAAEGAAAVTIETSLRAEGWLYEVLSLDRPYHTPFFEPYGERLKRLLAQWIVRPPSIPVYSCTSMQPYPQDLGEVHALAYQHWVRPVEFSRTIQRMWDDGVRIFVEAGPRGNLSAFIEDVLAGRSCAVVAANVSRRTGLTQLHHLLANLAAHGVPMSLGALYERRPLSRIDWSGEQKPARKRSLGRVKLPTSAPDMRLSQEMIALVRSRAGLGAVASVPCSAARASMAPHDAVTVDSPLCPPAVAPAGTPAATPVPPPAAVTSAVPVSAPALPARATTPTAMAAFLQTMDRFLAVEQSLLKDVFANAPAAYGPAGAPPLVERLEGGAGTALRARCVLDLERLPFLQDHTIGRNVSAADPRLCGFPIVPFTSLMEIMAETARMVGPHRFVIGMQDVRVHRWLAVDRGPLVLEITAEPAGDSRVSVRVMDTSAIELGPVADGVMVLGQGYPVAPAASLLVLTNEGPYKWPPDRLYGEAMFHGPLFRGVTAIDRIGGDGAEATLTVVPRGNLLGPAGVAGVATDLVLLDQPGQVVGFWANQQLERGFVVLPSRMAALHLYGPPLPEGERTTCRARIALVGDRQVQSDLDVVRADGRVWARFEGWEDHRFDVPHEVFRALLEPTSAGLARPWSIGGVGGSGLDAFRIGFDTFPPGWLHAHGGMWSRVLASLVLGRRERAIWHGLTVSQQRRLEWLLGRVAAKDVVRQSLRRRFDLRVHPADVEILPDQTGRPVVRLPWRTPDGRVPHVSISHVDGVAVAVLGEGNGITGVGIDIERRGRIKPGMAEMMLGAREGEFLSTLEEEERDSWALRLWCAREATAKATGCATGPVSSALAVERVDQERGTVLMRYTAPDIGSITLSASTARDGDWVVATCVDTSGRLMAEVPTV